jgi:hypothetical protein
MPIAVPTVKELGKIDKSANQQTSSGDMVNAAAEGSDFAAQANGVAEQVCGAGGKPLPELYKSVSDLGAVQPT